MSSVVAYPAARPSSFPTRETVLTKIAALWRAVMASRRRRFAVDNLCMLDARTLADIGIDRSEIKSIVYCGASERRIAHEDD